MRWRPLRSARDGPRPSRLWLLAPAMLLPGLVLAGFGLRGVQQEQRAAAEDARNRLDRAAQRGARQLSAELARWRDLAADLSAAPDSARRETLRRLGRVDAASDAPVLIEVEEAGPRAVPPSSLMFAAGEARAPDASATLPPAVAQAEDLELRSGAYDAAIRAYTQLLATVPPSARPAVLHGLGRASRKGGRLDAALRAYEELAAYGDALVGTLPASLVAHHERCAILNDAGPDTRGARCAADLYEGLVRGRWPIEKPRAEHYLTEARTWLRGNPATAANLARLEAEEAVARATADDVREALGERPAASSAAHRLGAPAGRVWMAYWSAGPSPRAVLVLPASFVRAEVWPKAFAEIPDANTDMLAVTPGGSVAYSTAPAGRGAAAEGAAASTRSVRDGDSVWQVQALMRGPGAIEASLASRQRTYLATLVVMVASLLAGSVVIARTVRREMDVARLKSQFVSAVSHEFRSPLTSIRQLAELLVNGVPTPERSRDYYRVILDESERLSRLVERVLDFSRMEEGRREYRREPLDTSPWLRGVAREAARHIGGKRLDLDVPERLPAIFGDGEALATAVHNLVDNAAKYSPACDTVWLSAEAAGRGVVVRVRDGGVGVPPGDVPHLFDRFFRGAATADAIKGTGLGLSLVKHVVDAHGGTVHVDSKPGEGTTVSLEIPTA